MKEIDSKTFHRGGRLDRFALVKGCGEVSGRGFVRVLRRPVLGSLREGYSDVTNKLLGRLPGVQGRRLGRGYSDLFRESDEITDRNVSLPSGRQSLLESSSFSFRPPHSLLPIRGDPDPHRRHKRHVAELRSLCAGRFEHRGSSRDFCYAPASRPLVQLLLRQVMTFVMSRAWSCLAPSPRYVVHAAVGKRQDAKLGRHNESF